MPVPAYQSLMRPILAIASDGQPHRTSDLIPKLADQFALTEGERDDVLPSGQRVIFNRTHWAVTYLAKARLVERVARGQICITERGREALASGERIDAKYLTRYPEFVDFHAHASERADQRLSAEHTSQTPEELLESTYDSLRRSVESDLLERVLASTPDFFEELVVDLLHRMGVRRDARRGSATSGAYG